MKIAESFGREMCEELMGRGYPVLMGIFDHQAQFLAASGYEWEGKTVLELGAFDGRHSEVAIRLGASSAMVVEGREENLKHANPAESDKVRFIMGDVQDIDDLRFFPASNQSIRYDASLIFGILYHLKNPVFVLKRALAYSKEAVFIWTHVADTVINMECEGYMGQRYQDPGVNANDAIEPLTAFWFAQDELVRCLNDNGFRVVRIVDMPTPVYPKPAVCLMAERIA